MKKTKPINVLVLSLVSMAGLIVQAGEIHDAVASGDISAVKRLIAAKPSIVDEKNENQIVPLHVAVRKNNLEMVQLLLGSKAVVRARTFQGITPLHDAASWGNLEIVKILLNADREGVNATNRAGMTPLMIAAGKDASVAAFLITNSANVNLRTPEGVTALHTAALKGRADCVALLLKNGADVNARDNRGNNAAHFVLSKLDNPHKEILQILIAHKIDLNMQGLDRRKPLDYAKSLGKPEVIELLKQNMAR